MLRKEICTILQISFEEIKEYIKDKYICLNELMKWAKVEVTE